MEDHEQRLISDQDILRISLTIERQGKAFYRELAKRIQDPQVQTFLREMAKEEAQHEKLFQTMLEKKGNKLYGWENRKDLLNFINTQFQTDIFPALDSLDKTSSKLQSLQEAVEFALEAERVSAEFYALLGDYCDDLEAKTALMLLEQAEKEHFNQVLAIKDKLARAGD